MKTVRSKVDVKYERLVDVIEMLKKELEAIPEERRASAEVDIEGGYDYGYELVIEYKRPYTAEELDVMAASEQRNKEYRRKQYEALKKEFEGK